MKNNITFEIELFSLKFSSLTPEKGTNMKGGPRIDNEYCTFLTKIFDISGKNIQPLARCNCNSKISKNEK